MKLAVLIAARRQPERVARLIEHLRATLRVPHEIFVAEAGSDGGAPSPTTSLWYRDSEFRGKAFGHCLALEHARLCGGFDCVWILTPAMAFESGVDSARGLLDLLEREPRMAIAAPTLSSRPAPPECAGQWAPIATCESLGFIMRMQAIEEIGFLNPDFLYGWGAMDELAHRLYQNGWFVARARGVNCHYLPTSTQGHDLSFDEYWRRARRFAFDYFRERHGEHWDELFWSATAGHGIEVNAFREHKRLWSSAFTPAELLERSSGELAPAIATTGERSAVLEEAASKDTRGRAALEPWPLATEAPYRLLAWPDYRDERELEQLFDGFARHLVARSDACLCLRFDAEHDGDEATVVERLQAVYARVLGADAPLEVLLVDDPLTSQDLLRLSAALAGYATLPSSAQGARRAFLGSLTCAALDDGDALRARLTELARPRYGREALDSVDFSIVRRIQALHPWSAPAVIGNLAVRPGHGTQQSPAFLQKRFERRKKAVIGPLVERMNLDGARVLELNAGFGLFSACLVAHHASRATLLEGRERERAQAQLYWEVNRFLPEDDWRVLGGTPADDGAWSNVLRRGPFDIALWCEALRDASVLPQRLRELARSVTRTIVVDLCGPDSSEVDAANVDRLRALLIELGFEIEAGDWSPPGTSGDERSARTVWFAHKPKVIPVIQGALPALREAAAKKSEPTSKAGGGRA